MPQARPLRLVLPRPARLLRLRGRAHPFVLQLVVTVISVAFTLVRAASGFEHTATWVGVGQTVGNLVGAILGFVLLRRRLGSLGLASVVQQNVRLLLSTLLATLVAGASSSA